MLQKFKEFNVLEARGKSNKNETVELIKTTFEPFGKMLRKLEMFYSVDVESLRRISKDFLTEVVKIGLGKKLTEEVFDFEDYSNEFIIPNQILGFAGLYGKQVQLDLFYEYGRTGGEKLIINGGIVYGVAILMGIAK